MLSSTLRLRRVCALFAALLPLAVPLAAQPNPAMFGGTGLDSGYGVAVDGSGQTVVMGFFQGTADFDPGAGTTNLTSAGSADVFVARYTPSGALVSAIRVGGTSSEFGLSVAVDGSGNAVVTGYFSGTVDFDPGAGTTNLTSAGSDDVFVARYTPSGALVSAIRVGGPSSEFGRSVAVDGSGNAVVTGVFNGTVDFDPGAGTTNLTTPGGSNVFVARYTPSGALVSAIRVGGGGSDYGLSVAVDGSGNAVVTSSFRGTVDFDPGAGTTNLTSTGFDDVFVARYTPSGALVSAIRVGGPSSDVGASVVVDGSGNAVVTGSFGGPADFDPGAGTTNLTSAGDSDVFLARYTPSGALVSAIRVGGTNVDRGYGVAVDGSGNAVVTGFFGGTVDFDPGAGTTNLTSAGDSDVFLARYTPSGTLAPVPTAVGDNLVVPGYRVSELSPNPSHGAAQMTVTVDHGQPITVGVYDLLGRRVVEAFAGIVAPGAAQSIALDVALLPSGVYVVRVVGGTFAESRRLVVAR